MLPEIGSILKIISPRSFRNSVGNSLKGLFEDELVVVLHGYYTPGGWPMTSQTYYIHLIVHSSAGIGQIFTTSAGSQSIWTSVK